MKKKKKILIIAGAVIVVGAIVVSNLLQKEHGKKVDAIVAERDNIISKVEADGTLKGLNQVQIGSDVIGRIVKMKVKEGDRVEEGDVLCIIEQSTYVSRVRQLSAILKLSRSKLEKAEMDMKRSTELFESQLISKEQYESAKLSYEMAASEVQSSKESYNEVKAGLDKTVIKSPVAGEVIQRNKEEGEMGTPATIATAASVIMTIADRSKMFVRALVDETEIVKVELGQSVDIAIDAFPDTTFTGEVVRKGGIPVGSGYGSEEAVNYLVEIEISGVAIRLYPGMSANCNITVGSRDSVIVIPYTALGRKKIDEEKDEEEKDIVILARDGKAKITEVKPGLTGEEGVEILKGVNVGDTVLTGPYSILRDLKDDVKVEPEFEEEEPEETEKDKHEEP
jgi:HlyD family secretion protein